MFYFSTFWLMLIKYAQFNSFFCNQIIVTLRLASSPMSKKNTIFLLRHWAELDEVFWVQKSYNVIVSTSADPDKVQHSISYCIQPQTFLNTVTAVMDSLTSNSHFSKSMPCVIYKVTSIPQESWLGLSSVGTKMLARYKAQK